MELTENVGRKCLEIVCDIVAGIPPTARASNDTLRDALATALEESGFKVARSVQTPYGELDIVATRDGTEVALDVERAEPGARAVAKLRRFQGVKVIVLRTRSRRVRRRWHPPAGLHAIIEAPD
jgi:hypothetical protein